MAHHRGPSELWAMPTGPSGFRDMCPCQLYTALVAPDMASSKHSSTAMAISIPNAPMTLG